MKVFFSDSMAKNHLWCYPTIDNIMCHANLFQTKNINVNIKLVMELYNRSNTPEFYNTSKKTTTFNDHTHTSLIHASTPQKVFRKCIQFYIEQQNISTPSTKKSSVFSRLQQLLLPQNLCEEHVRSHILCPLNSYHVNVILWVCRWCTFHL